MIVRRPLGTLAACRHFSCTTGTSRTSVQRHSRPGPASTVRCAAAAPGRAASSADISCGGGCRRRANARRSRSCRRSWPHGPAQTKSERCRSHDTSQERFELHTSLAHLETTTLVGVTIDEYRPTRARTPSSWSAFLACMQLHSCWSPTRAETITFATTAVTCAPGTTRYSPCSATADQGLTTSAANLPITPGRASGRSDGCTVRVKGAQAADSAPRAASSASTALPARNQWSPRQRGVGPVVAALLLRGSRRNRFRVRSSVGRASTASAGRGPHARCRSAE